MDNIRVSFAITTHNETTSLRNLMAQINATKTVFDEVILVDDFSTNEETKKILDEESNNGAKVFQHALNSDFAAHKNFMTDQCRCDYIFNLDADELMFEKLASTYKEILAINTDVEMFKLPRINKVAGITLDHINKWGWQISTIATEIESKKILPNSADDFLIKSFNLFIKENNGVTDYYCPIINYPDFQGRIYKKSDSIRWQGKVHETVVGFKRYSKFPATKIYSILHYKEIEKQVQQNELYSGITR